jgi:hypothetical protein
MNSDIFVDLEEQVGDDVLELEVGYLVLRNFLAGVRVLKIRCVV